MNKIKAGDIFRDLANSVILMVTCALVYLIDEEAYPNAVKFIDPILALSSIIITIWTSIGLSKKLGLTLLQGELIIHYLSMLWVIIFLRQSVADYLLFPANIWFFSNSWSCQWCSKGAKIQIFFECHYFVIFKMWSKYSILLYRHSQL